METLVQNRKISRQVLLMKASKFEFPLEVYNDNSELAEKDASLLNKAKEAAKSAYAPYSKFYVGAVARLVNGEFVSGTNQENASYPVGICAERSLLTTAAALFPGVPIESIAVTYNSQLVKSDHPISPCGMCRQALVEYETRVKQPIRLILGGAEGKTYIVEQSNFLLPFAFTSDELI
jgi:cytidine deaminase